MPIIDLNYGNMTAGKLDKNSSKTGTTLNYAKREREREKERERKREREREREREGEREKERDEEDGRGIWMLPHILMIGNHDKTPRRYFRA